MTTNGGKSILLLSVKIWATLIQVCPLSPLTLLIAFLSLFVAPLSVSNNGSWSTISYVSRYSSYYSTPSCHYSNESIVACLTNSSYYVTSYYARYRYCNTARDTLYIQCNFDMGKYILTCRCYCVAQVHAQGDLSACIIMGHPALPPTVQVECSKCVIIVDAGQRFVVTGGGALQQK